MMNDLKKRQLFWLLKRFSSVTYWERYKEAFQETVEAYESSLKTYEWLYPSGYELWLDGLIAFEKGIEKLKQGERFVFVYRHPECFLAMADEGAYTAWRQSDPREYNWDDNPDFDKIRQKAVHAFETYGRPPVINDTTQPERQQVYMTPGGSFVAAPYYFGAFPATYPADLPPVPAVSEDAITVRPGDVFPVYGIYQPYIEIPAKGIFFKSPTRWEEYGCMMYGLQDTEVPVSNKWEDNPKPVERSDVVWKLLWEDHRYEDGTIPEEEQSYFLDAPQIAVRPPDGRLRALPNDVVPKTGDWWSPAFHGANQVRRFEQGERFPATETTSYGAVIWYYDPERQSKQ